MLSHGGEHRSLEGAVPTGGTAFPSGAALRREVRHKASRCLHCFFVPRFGWTEGGGAFPPGALLPTMLPCSCCTGFLSATGNTDFKIIFPALKSMYNLVILHLMDLKQSVILLAPMAYAFLNAFSLDQPSCDS